MFYTDVLLSKHGSLANVWLAAHWEKKLTKDHVFRCNIEKTIGKIISHKVKFSLRTSGHLLLGVVRIYKRKMKYLWEDCNETAGKMSMTFRPGLSDLSTGDLEASYSAITLEEEFYDFDMDTINTIDASEHLTQNQSRPEEITLKEYYGKDLSLEAQNVGDHVTGNLLGENSLMCNSGDGFGDEGASETMMDFLWKADENCLLEDMPLEETLPLTPESHQGTSGKRMRKKRRLLIDPVKELSNKSICEQLSSFEDTLKPLEFLPPTRNLMMLKERDKVSTLLSTPFQHLDSDQLNKLFPTCLLRSGFKSGRSVKRDLEQNEENCYDDVSFSENSREHTEKALKVRDENWGMEFGAFRVSSSAGEEAMGHAEFVAFSFSFFLYKSLLPLRGHNLFLTGVSDSSSSGGSHPALALGLKTEKNEPIQIADRTGNELPIFGKGEALKSERFLNLVLCLAGKCSSALATLDPANDDISIEEDMEYNKMGIWSFNLKELCKNCNPKQVAATFNSLLQKQTIEL
ncbi:double-strand-break repair protein rad21-like protein 1 [Perognathus longimembris pacificus]|uniref:double-strand-break repair protein rad21-like protein 1 n=1 Tax=Perognathus longimembris pacificus TaxID=214514 RepID=UPI002019C30A|nr:double-strand-break repair protein rad21-like protein 1 [Perognathus longimembris pacificus]